jgi:ribosomal protein L37AE/L43A
MAKNKKICLLCGSTIIEQSASDPNICIDCEKEAAEARYLKQLFL